MNLPSTTVVEYFGTGPHSFWRWATDGEVVEWFDGETICYRKDLESILRGLAEDGLPPLNTVLLVLTACQGLDTFAERMHGLETQQDEVADRNRRLQVSVNYRLARQMLGDIWSLPHDLRSGKNRIHLIRELQVFSPETARTKHVPPDMAMALVDEFASGRLDALITGKHALPSGKVLFVDLVMLARASRYVQDTNSLAIYLRSGLNEIPGSLPELPATPPPIVDLLSDLEQEPQTAGLAQLTRRLLAALNIPMHARGASELPLGGVADITNRGDFDRLLLSELAHDDLTLTARLVNNEALFLRREEPPAQLERQRGILIDTTLKMWGIPRVFALSAALACARNDKHLSGVQAYALGGYAAEPVSLETKEGVLDTLSRLDGALHCGEALRRFFEQTPAHAAEDFILISDAEAMQHPDFQHALAEVRHRLHVLIALQRDGVLQWYTFSEGRGRLVAQPRFNLEELLFPKLKPQPAAEELVLPAFFQQSPSPLFFPMLAAPLKRQNCFYQKGKGVIVVTEQQRVLFWESPHHAARELLPFVETGRYAFGFGPKGEVCLLVYVPDTRTLKKYNFEANSQAITSDFSDLFGQIDHIACDNSCFYIKCEAGNVVFSVSEAPGDSNQAWSEEVFENYNAELRRMNFSEIKQQMGHHYSTIQRVKNIFTGPNKELVLGRHFLHANQGQQLLWDNGNLFAIPQHKLQHFELPENPNCRLYERRWPDGSRAIADARGLVHLIPGNPEQAQVTLLYIADTETAAWASDGAACGNPHFIHQPVVRLILVADFWKQYIFPFLDPLTESH
ncbi:MAG: hypothetical protein IT260_08835 [Saprospiraceae bacterium]|nr:hypothetical protein [Saprospiraceae bacterium]